MGKGGGKQAGSSVSTEEMPAFAKKKLEYFLTVGEAAVKNSRGKADALYIQAIIQSPNVDGWSADGTTQLRRREDTTTYLMDRYAEYDSAVGLHQGWADYFSEAWNVSSLINDDALIQQQVSKVAADTENEYIRAVSRFATSMADGNATDGSAFVIGMALMSRDRQRQLTSAATDLRVSAQKARMEIAASAPSLMEQMYQTSVSVRQNGTAMALELKKFILAMRQESIDKLVEYQTHRYLWDLDLATQGASMVSAFRGGTTSSQTSSGKKSSGGGMAALGAGIMGATLGGLMLADGKKK